MKRYDSRYDDCGMEEYDDGEWVPAHVAQGLYDALEELADEYQYHVDHGKPWERACAALAAADRGEV